MLYILVHCVIGTYVYCMGRYKQWNGLLEWNTGLDYWTELFSFFGQVYVFILEEA